MGLKRRKHFEEIMMINSFKRGVEAKRKLRVVISPSSRCVSSIILLATILCLSLVPSSGALSHLPPLPRGPHPPPPQNHNRDIPLRLTPHKVRLQDPPRFSRETPAGHPLPPINPPQPRIPRGKNGPRDLAAAAQTLYDLRGFNIPLGSTQDTQRFLRQNDPFTFSRFQPRNNGDSRTAPLVFPSFYQQQQQETTSKRPQQQVLNIFGHTQHLSQTKYEPAGSSSSGNSGNGNINTIQGQPQTFRPSQIDVGFARHQQQEQEQNEIRNEIRNEIQPNYRPVQFADQELNQLQGRQVPQPQAQVQIQNFGQSQHQNQPHQILNYRAPGQDNQNQNQNQQNNANGGTSSEEPFIYVYDDEDYDEGEEEFVDKPQQQINTNRVTTPSSRIVFPNPSSPAPSAKPLIQSTTTPIPLSQNHNQQQTDFYSQIHQNQQPQSQRIDPFSNVGQQFIPSRFSPTITPTPNVEIVPSSERKPPPDQSNAVSPIVKPTRIVNDDRFRRPASPSPNTAVNNNNFQPQPPIQQQYFPQNNNQNQNGRQTFNQVVNLGNEEDEEQVYEQDPEIIQKLNGFPSYDEPHPRPETKLRPVNTLVPKNRVPLEEFVLPPNFPFHEDIHVTRVPSRPTQPTTRPSPSSNDVSTPGQSNRGDIIRQNFRPQQQEVSPVPPPPPQHRLRPTPTTSSTPPSNPTPTRVRGSPIPTRTISTTTPQDIDSAEPPKRTRTRPHRPIPPANKIHTFPPFPTTRRPDSPTTTAITTTFRTTPVPRTTTTTTTTESYEADSDEYYEDDYSDSSQGSKDSFEPMSKQQVKTSSPNKSPIRPDFYNNNNRNQIQIQELHSPKIEEPRPAPQPPPRRIRPQSVTTSSTPSSPPRYSSSSLSPTQGPKRFREQPTIESPPRFPPNGKKTTTGKPLYYFGKMLSKEGGLYAGQIIPLNHVYGKPVPNVPINSIFDRMPAVLDGHVTRPRVTSPQPQVVSPAHVGQQHQQKRIRGREPERGERDRDQQRERQVVSSTPANVRTSTHQSSRLIHPSRIRPVVTNATPQSPPPTEREPERETIRARPKPRPRPTSSPPPPVEPLVEEEEEKITIPPPPPPRRRKVRPGQKKLRQQLLQKQEQSVSISHSVREENEDDQDRPEPQRKNLRPNLHRPRPQTQTQPIVQIIQSQSVSSTESSSPLPPSKPFRPRRPRPQQQQVQVLQSTSQRTDDVDDFNEEIPKPRPQKRIRPRAQKLQSSTQKLQSEFSEVISKSVSTQASAKIGRKPTEAPNRFSSRFRDDDEPPSTLTSTRSSVSESDHDHDHNHDDDGDETRGNGGLKHFSPPPKSKPRPSFKPPVKPARPTPAPLPEQIQKPKRIKPPVQKQPSPVTTGEPDDDLPPSIRLSAKDVVLNRKPARRIPPGSASDRLKALAERRKKIATPQSFRESIRDEEDEDGNGGGHVENKGHRTLRRRKLLNNNNSGNGGNDNLDNENNAEFIPKSLQQRRVVKKQRIARPRPVVPHDEEQEQEPAGDQEPEEKHHDTSDREFQQNKREITNKHSDLHQNKAQQVNHKDEDHGDHHTREEVDEGEDDVIHRPRQHSQRAYERIPLEVTSDEARSVLGIVINDHSNPVRQPIVEVTPSHYDEEADDYEGHPSHQLEHKVSTQVPPPSSSYPSAVQVSTSSLAYDDDDLDDHSQSYNSSSTSTTTTSTTSESPEASSPPSSTTDTPSSTTSTTTAAYLKSRLRPNKKLLASLQPKLSANQQRDKNESTRHTNLSKLLKFRTSSSTYSPLSNLNSKLFTMATEDPSLPLEEMFSNVNKS